MVRLRRWWRRYRLFAASLVLLACLNGVSQSFLTQVERMQALLAQHSAQDWLRDQPMGALSKEHGAFGGFFTEAEWQALAPWQPVRYARNDQQELSIQGNSLSASVLALDDLNLLQQVPIAWHKPMQAQQNWALLSESFYRQQQAPTQLRLNGHDVLVAGVFTDDFAGLFTAAMDVHVLVHSQVMAQGDAGATQLLLPTGIAFAELQALYKQHNQDGYQLVWREHLQSMDLSQYQQLSQMLQRSLQSLQALLLLLWSLLLAQLIYARAPTWRLFEWAGRPRWRIWLAFMLEMLLLSGFYLLLSTLFAIWVEQAWIWPLGLSYPMGAPPAGLSLWRWLSLVPPLLAGLLALVVLLAKGELMSWLHRLLQVLATALLLWLLLTSHGQWQQHQQASRYASEVALTPYFRDLVISQDPQSSWPKSCLSPLRLTQERLSFDDQQRAMAVRWPVELALWQQLFPGVAAEHGDWWLSQSLANQLHGLPRLQHQQSSVPISGVVPDLQQGLAYQAVLWQIATDDCPAQYAYVQGVHQADPNQPLESWQPDWARQYAALIKAGRFLQHLLWVMALEVLVALIKLTLGFYATRQPRWQTLHLLAAPTRFYLGQYLNQWRLPLWLSSGIGLVFLPWSWVLLLVVVQLVLLSLAGLCFALLVQRLGSMP